MSKRGGSELNHDNWDQDTEKEEAGTFVPASAETIKGRVIKRARRRNAGDGDEPKKNVFGAFGGFAAKTEAPSANTAFSFLAKPAVTSPAVEKPAVGGFSFGAGAEAKSGSFSFGAAASTADTGGGGAANSGFSFGAPASKSEDPKPTAAPFSFGSIAGNNSPSFGKSEDKSAPTFGSLGGASATPVFGSGATSPKFGVATTKAAPMFGSGSTPGTGTVKFPEFGAKSSDTSITPGAFAFGAKSDTDKKSEGATETTAPVKPSEVSKPGDAPASASGFSFGSSTTATGSSSATSGFSFGTGSTSSNEKPKPAATSSGFGFGVKSGNDSDSVKSSAASGFMFGSAVSSEKSKPETSPAASSLSSSKPASTGFSFGSTASESAKEKKIETVSKNPTVSGFSLGSSSDVSVSSQMALGSKSSVTKTSESSSAGNKEYLSHIKALNLQVLDWLKMHIEKDPLVILSPVFKDYDQHLEDIEKEFGSNKNEKVKGISESKTVNSSEIVPDLSEKKVDSTKSVSFGIVKPTSSTIPEKPTEIKTSAPAPASLFSFGSSAPASKPAESVASTAPFSFGTSQPKTDSALSGGFSFGSTSSSSTPAAPSMGFSTGGFSFGAAVAAATSAAPAATDDSKDPEDDEDQPPVVEVKQVEENDALYSKKCKLFYKKDGNYAEKGVGMLYLKSVDGGKTQLLIRADTNLGNVLLNIILSSGIPTTRVGKNNVMLVCVPNPPVDPKSESTEPCPMLIRVKATEDADELKAKLDEYKDK